MTDETIEDLVITDETIEDLKERLHTFSYFVGKKVREDATQTYMHISLFCLMESSLEPYVVLETAHRPPIRWSRPAKDLFSGAFTIFHEDRQ